MIIPWHVSDALFKFQLSDKTLWRKKRRLLSGEFGVGASTQDVLPAFAQGKDGPVGYQLRGVPVDQKPPPFQWQEGWLKYCADTHDRYFLDLGQSFDNFLKSFSSKSRQTLKRKVKKLQKESNGTLLLKSYQSPAELKQFYRVARQVSCKTYQEKLLDAGLPEDEAFFDQMLEQGRHNEVRAFVLLAHDQPISYLYLTASGSQLIYKYLGYDPAWRAFSAGVVLHYLAIERLMQEAEFKLLDFTEGGGQQKQQFSSGKCQCALFYLLKPSISNLALVVSHWLMNCISQQLGWLIKKLGLQAKMKRLLRFGLKTS